MNRLTKVNFTNLDRILFPDPGILKKQVIEYYIRVAPRMLRFLEGRIVVRNRFPQGIGHEGFYEKDAPMGTPEWVEKFKWYSKSADRELQYVVGGELDTLLWLANLAALEINITLSKAENYDYPDLVFIDVDPEPPADFINAVTVAKLVREKLVDRGLTSFIKTSGKKGLHIIIPIKTEYSFRKTRSFVHDLGRELSKESELIVSEFSQGRDKGTVFIDFMQNNQGKTMIAPYSLRAVPGANVSTPIDWKEVKKGLKPDKFNINTVMSRKKSPWDDLFHFSQSLEEK